MGKNINENELFDQVLYLEQLLTTGGGWQDQVGGLTSGLKLITTKPGIPQDIHYENLVLSPETFRELNQRLIIIFTGQRRLAKRILREIMGQYILNNPDIKDYLFQIQKIAVMMKFELEKGNLDTFAELMNEHWEINQKLDPGSTNSYIKQIFNICKPYMAGGKICGAGGGGFIQVLLKKAEYKEKLQHNLNKIFQDSDVGIWESKIVDKALVVEK
jgi:fucokinase